MNRVLILLVVIVAVLGGGYYYWDAQQKAEAELAAQQAAAEKAAEEAAAAKAAEEAAAKAAAEEEARKAAEAAAAKAAMTIGELLDAETLDIAEISARIDASSLSDLDKRTLKTALERAADNAALLDYVKQRIRTVLSE